MTLDLSLASLGQLATEVMAPKYRRETLSAGMLHIGVGNFHRAHQAVYLDDLFNLGRDHDWAIIGGGVRAGDAATRTMLEGQDWLTTVVEAEAGQCSPRVTGAMIDYLPVDDQQGLVAMIADPKLRILSLTITEGGYCLNAGTGRFDPDHPDIRADAADIANPRHVFGVMVAGLKARRAAGGHPLTIMSCDNVQENGHVTREAVTGLAELVDHDLARWIEGEIAFPNSMVDRITPATTDLARERLRQQFGLNDAWPVFCEPYRQWVVEDLFACGRPSYEEVGVTMTDDVARYELLKIRMLNGGHAAIAYPAALLGIQVVHGAIAQPLIKGFLQKLECDEIIPILPTVPDVDLNAYLDLVLQRFANPDISDTIPRLCQDGSNRQPKFILPSTRERLAKGQDVTGLALVSALWCRYCFGETDHGQPIKINDELGDRLVDAAKAARTKPEAFLALRDVFGVLAESDVFHAAFAAALSGLWQDGVNNTLARYINLQPGESL